MRTTTFNSGFTLKINCVHGFITIEEMNPGEVSRFMNIFEGFEIVPLSGGLFTLADLLDVPDYSIKGADLLTLKASVTIAAEPGEVMRANEIVYDFNAGTFKKITAIKATAEIIEAQDYYLSPGLILPGSLTDEGSRVTDYAARYLFSEAQFKYSSIEVTP